MLLSLQIKNYVLVEHLTLEFATGMTAFTGETGAGKSIMIDALMLALGARADSSIIRPGAPACEVLAEFSIEPESQIAEYLSANDWASQDNNQVIMRRLITTEGRSKCYLNDNTVTLQALKNCGEFLVHVHGQHEHQSLLKPHTHLEQLDRFAGHDKLLQNVKAKYSELTTCKAKLLELEAFDKSEDKLAFLQHQLDEFKDLVQIDYSILAEEHKTLQYADDYLKIVSQISDLSLDQEHAALSQIHKVIHKLSSLPLNNNHIQTSIGLFEQARINIEEGLSDLNQFANNINLDPERLHDVETEIAKLHNLARKHRVDIRNLGEVQQKLLEEYAKIENLADNLVKVRLEYETKYDAFLHAANALSQSRASYAAKLADAITEIIQDLGMPKGYLEVKITQNAQPTVYGIDHVEYYICTNPGMPLSPLQKIASGGELSRISLAIEVVTAKRSQTPTLLFDEVDVGIGGTTAAIVGKLLHELSQRLQIFCVTHQPQIAGFAKQHYQVNKEITDNSTLTNMILLQQDNRIDELARMLGGLTINEQTRSHAKQLLILNGVRS